MNEEIKPENMRIHSRTDELIACLEGEIAKRDAELAACRVAVENCDVFRARIAELEDLVISLQCKAIESDDLRAELSAIKAQEPVAWAGVIEDCASLFVTEPRLWKAIPLYAAPVSEAKAQGVVLTDEELCSIRNQVACNEVRRDDDSRTICVKHGRALEAAVLARLNAAHVQQDQAFCEYCGGNDEEPQDHCMDCTRPVQQVIVPDGWKLVPVEPTREMISAAGGAITTPDDLPPVGAGGWSMNDLAFRSRYRDAISAAPAAPAADACKACKGTGRRPIGGRGRIFGLTNRCFECQPLTDEEVYGQVTAHD